MKALKINSKLDIVELIGKGGMGTVYKVYHKELCCNRAVKVLKYPITISEKMMQRFKQEAVITAGLHHPNIVQVYDLDYTEDGIPYIIMEYLDGENFDSMLKREKKLELSKVVSLLLGVVSAIDNVHAMGIVHMDLKPANLFLTRSGVVKVLDFGVSFARNAKEELDLPRAFCGTPMYMAPEQIKGDSIDSRVDIYSLGVVAYELLTGKNVFTANTAEVLIRQIMEDPITFDFDDFHALPSHAIHALLTSMAKRPEDRFKTGWDFLTALAGPQLLSSIVDVLLPLTLNELEAKIWSLAPLCHSFQLEFLEKRFSKYDAAS